MPGVCPGGCLSLDLTGTLQTINDGHYVAKLSKFKVVVVVHDWVNSWVAPSCNLKN